MAVLLRPLFCIVLAFSRTDGARAAATCTVHHPYDRVVHSFREKSSQGSSYLGCSAMELNNFVHRVFGTAQAHALRPQWNERGRPGCPELFRMEPSFRASFHDASPEDRPSSSANPHKKASQSVCLAMSQSGNEFEASRACKTLAKQPLGARGVKYLPWDPAPDKGRRHTSQLELI